MKSNFNLLILLTLLFTSSARAQVVTGTAGRVAIPSEFSNSTFELCNGLTPPDAVAGTVPAYQSITHPDVYFNPNGFAGWRYWMTATPYPDLTRENPCVFRSQNGVDWTPAGQNPIHTYAEAVAATYEWNADTDIVVASNGVMQVYWCQFTGGATPKTRLVRKTTKNGVSWTSLEPLIAYTGGVAGDYNIVSPSIVTETNGSLTMFYARQTSLTMGPLQRIAWRSSTDNGATWGSETLCSYVTNRAGWPFPWHINVERAGGTYYMLAKDTAGTTTDVQSFGLSTNKTDWKFFNVPAWHNTGLTNFDYAGNYRCAFTVQSQFPPRFNVWVSGVPRDYLNGAVPGVGNADRPWLIGLLRNTPLPAEQWRADNVILPPASIANRAAAQVWFAANWGVGNRFTLTQNARVRYLNLEVGVQSGNIEVGIVRFRSQTVNNGDSHLIADTVYTSGVIGCPASGQFKHDMGTQLLGPGEYAIYLWCDNIVATFYHVANADAGWLGGSKSTVVYNVAAAGGYAIPQLAAWTEDSDRAVAGLSLSNH